MKVVIAIDSFKGSMSSIEAGEAAAAGIRKVYSEAKTKVYPLADGGEGTVRALAQGLAAEGGGERGPKRRRWKRYRGTGRWRAYR